MNPNGRAWVLPTLILALVALAVPIAGLMLGRGAGALAPLRWIEVSGSFERVTAEQVRAAVTPALGGGFFFLPLDEVRTRVQELSWVEKAQVRKRWPDVLEIQIIERSVLAKLGTDRLLDEQGRVFSAERLSMMGGVPQFEAGEARVPQAIAFYTAIRPDLQGLGLDLTELRISRRGSIETVLSNGIEVIVGSTDQADRWRRFMVGLRPLMEQSATPIARIDLRYTNGFAVLPYSPDQAPADPAGAPPEQASTGDA